MKPRPSRSASRARIILDCVSDMCESPCRAGEAHGTKRFACIVREKLKERPTALAGKAKRTPDDLGPCDTNPKRERGEIGGQAKAG
jgi:hypothetical protein